MCLAIPSKIIELDDIMATVEVGGARKSISLQLMPEDVGMGDYVLVHAGYAIQKVDEEAALEAHRLLREIALQMEAEGALHDPFDDEGYVIPPSMPPI
ncbi:MAG: HypC/HybG/HupF family hydrogenase formation chaperone [Thermodesulfovibrionales bacterium]|nr:HypC/HybG/HupF family hydrogenase formation chaperone [Thermodesulfovibrionales bacterium]